MGFFFTEKFQSTLPLRGATRCKLCTDPTTTRFQSTLPLRGATASLDCGVNSQGISIHAPLTGSDGSQRTWAVILQHFNPRSPYGERLPVITGTLPASVNFNPRSPYGERPAARKYRYSRPDFNPRSPYGERLRVFSWAKRIRNFNPRSPYGERPQDTNGNKQAQKNFNPRSPYGERPESTRNPKRIEEFQSTLPLRGATVRSGDGFRQGRISIHAPLTGSDTSGRTQSPALPDFNPRSPYGERHHKSTLSTTLFTISIHAPLTGSDIEHSNFINKQQDFNPRSPYGERLVDGGSQ